MDSENAFPHLLGDGHGRYRVHIVGNSGSGKTTTATVLARILNVPCISMDRILWQPGWVETPREEFGARLRNLLDEATKTDGGWVVEGNCEKRGGLIAFEESTDVIWLDPPLILYLPRLMWRTFLRLFRMHEPCSAGCFERPSEVFFSRDSIIWWCITKHWTCRNRYAAKMKEIGLENGRDVERRRMRRFGGWGSSLKNWLANVENTVHLRTTSPSEKKKES